MQYAGRLSRQYLHFMFLQLLQHGSSQKDNIELVRQKNNNNNNLMT